MSLSSEGVTPAWLNGRSADSFWTHHIGDGRPPYDSTEVYGEDGLSFSATAMSEGFEFGYMDTLAALVSELELGSPWLTSKEVAAQATLMATAMRVRAEAAQLAETPPVDGALEALHIPEEAAAAAAVLYAQGLREQATVPVQA